VEPPAAVLILVVAVGFALGVDACTFVYARGASYLTNDPAACANCHVMRVQYDGWIAGSHRAAVCNDCHTPPGPLGKHTTKALNGFWRGRKLAAARDFQRKAQFYPDLVEAANSMGFPAPPAAARILAESIDFIRQGRLALREPRPR
jgi:formate-dependent nitrite reductase cytochrome c552 subunit